MRSVAVVRRLAAAYAETDVSVIDELLSDDVVFHVPGDHPLSGIPEGAGFVKGCADPKGRLRGFGFG